VAGLQQRISMLAHDAIAAAFQSIATTSMRFYRGTQETFEGMCWKLAMMATAGALAAT
jgi:hypothetical protein